MRIPLDKNILELRDIPFTVSYVIRKVKQVNNLYELPDEKRPPEYMIWDGTTDDIKEWLDKVFDRKSSKHDDIIQLDDLIIEG